MNPKSRVMKKSSAIPDFKCGRSFFVITCILAVVQGAFSQSTGTIGEISNRRQVEAVTTSPPSVTDVEACTNETIPLLTVSGSNIKWYSSDGKEGLLDSRDSKSYETVVIGGQIWMAENLNHGTKVLGTSDSWNDGVVQKYCYDNSETNCTTYGGLYEWAEMMGYTTTPEAQGICPTGWHIPTHTEWKVLEIQLGMSSTDADLLDWRGSDQGAQLKDGGSSGFDLLMAGKREPEHDFKSKSTYATLWTSTQTGLQVYDRTFSATESRIFASKYDDKENAFSVRCLKDETGLIGLGNSYNTGVSQAGTYTYWVTQTVNGVESNRVSVRLIIHPGAEVNLGADQEGCEGDIVVLDAGAGYSSYTWSTSSTSRTTQVSQTGTYEVTVTNAYGCEASDQVYVEFFESPVVEITGDTEVCEGETANLDAGAGYSSYQWSTGSSSSNISVQIGGYYDVTVTDAHGCEGSDQVLVIVNPPVQVDISGQTEGCEGTSIELDAGPGFTEYLWSTDETSRKIFVNSSGTYSVAVLDEHGCGSADDITVSFISCQTNQKPSIDDQVFNINENISMGSVVGILQASDPDIGQLLSFKILSGNEQSPFSLDTVNGVITVHDGSFLNYEVHPQFTLRIRVRDNGPGFLTDTANITVNVMDLNEPPTIGDQVFVINENLPKGTWIGEVVATDEDQGQRLYFEMIYGNDYNAFSLDRFSGDLTVNNPEAMDYETNPAFHLNIRVTDDGSTPLSSTGILDINLNDLNETAIGERTNTGYRIYPNPANQRVFVELDGSLGGEPVVEVYDSRGVLMKQFMPGSLSGGGGVKIEVPLAAKGMYFIKISSEKVTKVERIICH